MKPNSKYPINEYFIKSVLMEKIKARFKCCFIATEAGKYKSDILYIHKGELIEIEVKMTKSGLKTDLNKKKHEITHQDFVHLIRLKDKAPTIACISCFKEGKFIGRLELDKSLNQRQLLNT